MSVPRQLVAAAILFCWMLALALNAPGHLSFDSVVQLLEGRTGVFGSMHPPVMSALLGLADRVVPGTALYLAGAGALFFGALLVAFGRPAGARRGGLGAAALLLLALLSPLMLIYQGIVWKDVLFANAAVAAFAAAGLALRRQAAGRDGRAAWALAFLLAALAATARQNGLLVPLGVACVLAAAPAGGGRARRIGLAALAFAATLGAVGGAAAVVRALAVAAPADTTAAGLRALQGFDIQGMAARGARVPETPSLGPDAAAAVASHAAANYRPARLDPIGAAPAPAAFLALGAAEVGRLWWTMMQADPGAYLAHRAAVLRWHLWPPDIRQCLPVHVGVAGPAEGLAALRLVPGTRPADERLYAWAARFFETPMFRNAAWMVAILAILAVLLRRRLAEPEDRAMVAMLATALAFAASYAVIGIACDVRYLFFLPAATCLGLAHLARGRRPEPRG